MILFSHCKINLGLSVIARRDDGFSEIETVMYPLQGISDIVEIVPAAHFAFSSSGIVVDCPIEDNLCVRALRLVQSTYGITENVKIHLHKNIPFGAGLGAGSANAVAVIKLCNTIYNIGMSRGDMLALASTLGSDTAFFVDEHPAIATGRGEILEPINIDLKGYYVMLAKPDVAISTAAAYRHITPREPKVRTSVCVRQPIEQWRECLVNDFEAIGQFSALEHLKQRMYDGGAIYAAMSGSGSTIYGIFREKPTLSFDIFTHVEQL